MRTRGMKQKIRVEEANRREDFYHFYGKQVRPLVEDGTMIRQDTMMSGLPDVKGNGKIIKKGIRIYLKNKKGLYKIMNIQFGKDSSVYFEPCIPKVENIHSKVVRFVSNGKTGVVDTNTKEMEPSGIPKLSLHQSGRFHFTVQTSDHKLSAMLKDMTYVNTEGLLTEKNMTAGPICGISFDLDRLEKTTVASNIKGNDYVVFHNDKINWGTQIDENYVYFLHFFMVHPEIFNKIKTFENEEGYVSIQHGAGFIQVVPVFWGVNGPILGINILRYGRGGGGKGFSSIGFAGTNIAENGKWEQVHFFSKIE